MLRLLHLADLHLGWAPAYMDEPRRSERQRRRNSLLERAVRFALDPANRIGMVVIAGDLFESHRPDRALVASVLEQLRRLEAAGVRVVTVPGNHDEITYPDSVYRERAAEWPGLLVQSPVPVHARTVTVGGVPVHVYGLAYTGGLTPTREPLAQFPRVDEPGFHLAVLHGTLGTWGGERSLPLDGAALGRAGYDYVALGHIHRHERHDLGGTPAVYCGAVECKGWDDPGVGQWTVVDVEMPAGLGGRPRVEVRTYPAEGVQPIETVSLDAGAYGSAAELRAAIEALADPERIVQVRLTGAPAFEVSGRELEAALAGRFFHLSIVDDEVLFAPALLERWASEPTIRGLFVKRMQAKIAEAKDDETRRLLQRALRQGIHALAGGGAQ
ncbi:MAG TPA: DNA repair exonuclease [Limnochordales bacterium]